MSSSGCSHMERQRGVALLAAILLVALGTILAASIAFQSAMAARRGIASMSFEQSVLVAQGAEALAAYGLREDTNSTDDYSESWAQPFGPTEITPGVVLEARVEDMQGRFNLNNLLNDQGQVDPLSRDAFQRLLQLLGLEPKWADQMVDWLDGDIAENSFDGLEDGGTTSQQPPYRVANTLITSTSELLGLPGFGRERYVKLAPYVAALPPQTPLNVCTAPGPVLDAMHGEQVQYSNDPEQLAKDRLKECFPHKDDYLEGISTEGVDPATARTWRNSQFAENSRYYRLTSVMTLGGSDFALYSLLQKASRSGGSAGSQGRVRVLQRSFTPD